MDSLLFMQEEGSQMFRFPWGSLVLGAMSGACALSFVSCCVFSLTYNSLRGRGVDFWHLFGAADESSGMGIIILLMFHVPLGSLLGTLYGYCWGAAQNGFTQRTYIVSHWSGLVLGAPLLVLTAFSLTGVTRGWLLSSFIWGFPFLGAVVLFGPSYRFRQEMRYS